MSRWLLGITLAFALVGRIESTADGDSAGRDMLQQGDAIGVFYVTKVAGAQDDGVEPGEDLCYRCRYGSSPMVMVFTRGTDGKVVELVQRIDAAVSKNEESRLRGLVTLMGEDAAQLKEEAGKIAQACSVKKVPIVVAKEIKTGPLNYKLPLNAAVTVVVAKDSQVVHAHTFATDKIDVAMVMREVQQMLN